MAIPVEAAVDLAGRIAAGELTADEARIAAGLIDDGADEPETPERRAHIDAVMGAFIREQSERSDRHGH